MFTIKPLNSLQIVRVMHQSHLKTRKQIAQELGVSYSTLYRRMKNANLEMKGNLLCKERQNQVKALFGLASSPYRTRQDKPGQDRTRQVKTGQDKTGQDKTGQRLLVL